MKRLLLLLPVLLAAPACVPFVAAGAGTAGVAVAQERTLGRAVDDATIQTRIWNNYMQQGAENLYSKVGIEVTEGVVLLTGSVPTQDHVASAVQLAWDVDGVKEVINELQVTEAGGPKRLASDSWITTQAKTRLIAEKNVKSVNYTIETVNGVVYVMGIAQSQDELARVLNVVSRVKGVQKVVSHVREKNDPRRNIGTTGATQAPAPVQSNSY